VCTKYTHICRERCRCHKCRMLVLVCEPCCAKADAAELRCELCADSLEADDDSSGGGGEVSAEVRAALPTLALTLALTPTLPQVKVHASR